MQLELGGGRNVGVERGRRGAPEHDRRAVDDDLQRLQLAAVLDPSRIVRHIAVDEGVGLAAVVDRWRVAGGAADILDDVDVAFLVGVNPLIATLAQERIERADLRWPIDGDLDHAAIGACLLSEQKRLGERVVGGTVDRPKSGLARGRIDRGQERDAMRAAAWNVEIDARDVGKRRAVLVALKQEATAVVKAWRWAARIVMKNQVRVLIRLR